jgi:hypothetical protein
MTTSGRTNLILTSSVLSVASLALVARMAASPFSIALLPLASSPGR